MSGNWRALARATQELHIANDDGDNGDEDNCADDDPSSIQGNAVQRVIANADVRTSTNFPLTMLGFLASSANIKQWILWCFVSFAEFG